MPLPDYWNQAAFDATIGSRMTEEEEALEGFKAKALLTIKRAFEEYPLNTRDHALTRWVEIRKRGMDPAYRCFSLLVGLTKDDEAKMRSELDYMRDANNEFDIRTVIQGADSYMTVIERRLQTEGLC